MLKSFAAAALALLLAGVAAAQAPAEVLFRDVRVFDGKSDRLTAATSVLVRGNRIAAIGPAAVATAPGATVVEGAGRTLMPGLIDAHWHTILIRPTPEQAIYGDLGFTNLLAGAEARATLMRGFTSVRDLGGPSFGLKQAIDRGVVEGPRIWPSGAMITVTSGHGDFRMLSELPRDASRPLSRMEQIGGSMVVDSPDTVRQRVREQLMLGASQIKLTAGGGVVVAAQPARCLDLHARGIESGGRCRDQLGHLCLCPRLHTDGGAPRDRRRGESHRTRAPDRRCDRQVHRRQGHLAVYPALPGRRNVAVPAGFGPVPQEREVVEAARLSSTVSCASTASRRPSAPTSCSPKRRPAGRASCWLK